MLTPPSSTIVMISNSKESPMSPRTAPKRAAKRIPANAEMIPDAVNKIILTLETLIPEYSAAF